MLPRPRDRALLLAGAEAGEQPAVPHAPLPHTAMAAAAAVAAAGAPLRDGVHLKQAAAWGHTPASEGTTGLLLTRSTRQRAGDASAAPARRGRELLNSP